MSPEPFELSYSDERPQRFWYEIETDRDSAWHFAHLRRNHSLRVEVRDYGGAAYLASAVYLRSRNGRLRYLPSGDTVSAAGSLVLSWYRDWRRGENAAE